MTLINKIIMNIIFLFLIYALLPMIIYAEGQTTKLSPCDYDFNKGFNADDCSDALMSG